MLKRVVAIFDATQKVRKSPGTLAGDGDLDDLEGIRVGVMMPRTRIEHICSGVASSPDVLRQRSEPALRATTATSCSAANGLLDYAVGGHKQRWRHCQAECLPRF